MAFLQKLNLCLFISKNTQIFFVYRGEKIIFAIGFLILLSISTLSFELRPHPTLNSSFEVDIYSNYVSLDIKVPIEELKSAIGDKNIENKIILHPYILDRIRIKNNEGSIWKSSLEDEILFIDNEKKGEPNDLQFSMKFFPDDGEKIRSFIIQSDFIQREILDHQILIYVRKDWESGIFSDNPGLVGTIRFLNNSVSIDRTRSSLWIGFLSTFELGIRHILEGYDHLLFLCMLLLPAPLIYNKNIYSYKNKKDTLLYLIKIVSSFTIGHSLTLILGTLKLISPSMPLVELIIAVSVFVSAIHVVLPLFFDKEYWIAGGFGLIHGLAFSETISEFGLHSTALLLSILGFNLGIELIQLVLIIFFIPLLFVVIKINIYIYFKNILGIIGIILSFIWIYTRFKLVL